MTKPPLWATIFTILGVLILCRLGIWQVERLHWKENLIAGIARAAASAPVELDSISVRKAAEDETGILRGTLTGQYLHEHEIHVGPRPRDGTMGFHIVTPFRLQDGGIVFVLRGWVAENDPAPVRHPDGMLTISGILKNPASPNPFTPENAPAKNQWYTIDPAGMGSATGLSNTLPMVFYAQSPGAGGAGWPIPVDAAAYPDNNHLSYAIFWFSMAVVMIAIYILRFAVTPRRKKEGE